MAKEYIELEPGNEYGVISLNKTVFSTIAKNVIEEDENVQIAEGTKPFKTGIVESISYMTDFKPEAIEIQVTGFIF